MPWRPMLPGLVLIALVSACSTMKPVELPAAELQRMILAGEIPLEGEWVRIVTGDGKTHKYEVTSVDTDERLIRGKKKAVPIDDVVAIETAELSLGKTALLAGGSYLFIMLVAVAATPMFVL